MCLYEFVSTRTKRCFTPARTGVSVCSTCSASSCVAGQFLSGCGGALAGTCTACPPGSYSGSSGKRCTRCGHLFRLSFLKPVCVNKIIFHVCTLWFRKSNLRIMYIITTLCPLGLVYEKYTLGVSAPRHLDLLLPSTLRSRDANRFIRDWCNRSWCVQLRERCYSSVGRVTQKSHVQNHDM